MRPADKGSRKEAVSDQDIAPDLLAVRIMTAYDDQNAFAKILRGEIPCYRVYENPHTLAFLDIMPRSPGHTLVIPKAAARGILDITPSTRT